MIDTINIVSFDIPYPPDYGGAIDVYYKIKALRDNGIKVILHCFQYNKTQSNHLEVLCEHVYYYQRKTSIWTNISILPYTVYGRKNKTLINNLLKNEYPIIFEGLVSSYYLKDKRLRNRIKVFRESNVEHTYYYKLAQATDVIWKKIFFYAEGIKLQLYESIIKNADIILPVSENDYQYFKQNYPQNFSCFIPPFHPNNELECLSGKGNYILYHGNLAVPENEYAAIFLCKYVFSLLPYHCIVAGRKPTKQLKQIIQNTTNIELIENPKDDEMEQLIKQAHINVIITFQNTGFKLKLLHALFAGRYVIANHLMTSGSMLDNVCNIANSPDDMVKCCQQLMQRTFTQHDIQYRSSYLFPFFSNQYQAKKIIQLIQKHA